jgi:hypothetical protein
VARTYGPATPRPPAAGEHSERGGELAGEPLAGKWLAPAARSTCGEEVAGHLRRGHPRPVNAANAAGKWRGEPLAGKWLARAARRGERRNGAGKQ